MTLFLTVLGSATVPPLDPTAEQAREQLIHELSNPVYAAAKPTLIQTISQTIADWFGSLRLDGLSGIGGVGGLVIILIVVVALVVAFLIFGLPRLSRRTRQTGALFGDEDDRDSDTLRRAADAAAAAGDYATAIAEAYRSIARDLAERTIVAPFPGTTAHGFAEEAAAVFPVFGSGLRAAADAFDRVRYLGQNGNAEEWSAIRQLADELRTAKAQLEDIPA